MSTKRRVKGATGLLLSSSGDARTWTESSRPAGPRLAAQSNRTWVALFGASVVFALFYLFNHQVTKEAIPHVNQYDQEALRAQFMSQHISQSQQLKATKASPTMKMFNPILDKAITRIPKQESHSQNSLKRDSAVDVLNRSLPASVNITPLAQPLEKCHSTIVTGYFRIRSKFTASEYLKWMQTFLSVQDCLVIFSSKDMMENMVNLRKHAPARTVLIEMEINDLPISRLRASSERGFWQHQLDIDYEKNRHKSFELFWVWLSKSWCVKQAIERDFFGSEIYMWQDIGSFRAGSGGYKGKTIIEHPEMIPRKSLLWMAHHPPNAPPDPIWNDKRGEKQYYFHSGSQAAGHKDVWLPYHQKFAETMDMFLEKDMFIGEDQCVLQGTCQRFPDMCAYVSFKEVADNHYFGLRHVLRFGGKYNYWRMPGVNVTNS